jgi:8-oxo-dGTP diphosphatase
MPLTCQDIDWSSWKPQDLATLLFVVRDGQILLIRKKRGLGAGKVSGPGGRIEAGETPAECAVREVQEELRVTPTGLRHHGEHRFHFLDGYTLHCHIFIASDCQGQAQETDEAIPMWTPIAAIPYDEMWADDRHWLPLALNGARVLGHWIFDGDTMVDMDLKTVGMAAAVAT